MAKSTFTTKWSDFWKIKDQAKRNAFADAVDIKELETPKERQLRLRSLWILHIVTFIFSLSFSIVFTGVYPYLLQVTILLLLLLFCLLYTSDAADE